MPDYNRPTIDLYRHWDDSGNLLYVGISLNAAARASQHAKDKTWWPEVATITVEHLGCISRSGAESIEAAAIKAENPRYNVVHNGIGSGARSGRKSGKDRSFDYTWLLYPDRRATYEGLLKHIHDMGLLFEKLWGDDYSEEAFIKELIWMAELTLYPDCCDHCDELEDIKRQQLPFKLPYKSVCSGDGAEFRYYCPTHNTYWSCWYAYREAL
jgi:hypothetical protein